MQAASKTAFQIFYFNEIARRTVSIFLGPPTNDHSKVNRARRLRRLCNSNLGQDYEKNSFGGRLVGRDWSEQRGKCSRCLPASESVERMRQRRRSLQELFVPRRLSRQRFLQPLGELLPAGMGARLCAV